MKEVAPGCATGEFPMAVSKSSSGLFSDIIFNSPYTRHSNSYGTINLLGF